MEFTNLIVVHHGCALAAISRALSGREFWAKTPAKNTRHLYANMNHPAFIRVTCHGETSYWQVQDKYTVTPVPDSLQKRGVFCLWVSGYDTQHDLPTICDSTP